MRVFWNPPVPPSDIAELAKQIPTASAIVSGFPEFAAGNVDAILQEYVVHETEFIVHLDTNILSRLVEIGEGEASLQQVHRSAAALMSIGIMCEMKMNPTFATHEYAFGGSGDPDSRNAEFYHLDNLHPQEFADVALGRIDQLLLPPELPHTPHRGTHRRYLQGHESIYVILLKIVEIHTSQRHKDRKTVPTRVESLLELIDWMFADFMVCEQMLDVASQLWGMSQKKSVLKKPNTQNLAALKKNVHNAAWDINLVRTWAKFELD